MNSLAKLPAPDNARDLELERLREERDAAVARAEELEKEVHRIWCGLSLQLSTLEGQRRMRRARKPLELVGAPLPEGKPTP